MFSFKEEIKFHSQSVKNGDFEKKIDEHWTPISFFRDLIWIKQEDTNAPKVFTSEKWYLIFNYAYRTISISKKENELLDNGYKSKRAFSAYDKLNIKICSEDKRLWAERHKI